MKYMNRFKIFDCLRLGWKNIAGHKGRSAIIVVTISVLFAAVLGFNTLLNGVERTFANATSLSNDGKFYVATGFEPETFSCLEDINERCVLTPAPDNSEEIIQKRLERYHGKKIGTVYEKAFYWWEERPSMHGDEIEHIQHLETFYVISESVVQSLGIEYANVVDDRLPVILPVGKSLSEAQQQKFYQVGSYPATKSGQPIMSGGGFMNLILGTIRGSLGEMFLIDDGSGKIERFFDGKNDSLVSENTNNYENRSEAVKYDVAIFTDVKDVFGYYDNAWQEGREFGYDFFGRYTYHIKDVFGNTVNVASAFMSLRMITLLIVVVILVIAVCVATLTFVHVISDDAPTVALYRSMGASRLNILGIYLVYIVLLCLLAIIVCIAVTFLLVAVAALVYGSSLAETIKSYYMLSDFARVTFWGYDWISGMIIGVIILVAPLTLLLSLRIFSSKHIAKQLKED